MIVFINYIINELLWKYWMERIKLNFISNEKLFWFSSIAKLTEIKLDINKCFQNTLGFGFFKAQRGVKWFFCEFLIIYTPENVYFLDECFSRHVTRKSVYLILKNFDYRVLFLIVLIFMLFSLKLSQIYQISLQRNNYIF